MLYVLGMTKQYIQATSVSYQNKAILITGKPGIGKSSLALRLIESCGAVLISDDVTEVRKEGDILIAVAPDSMRGCIEVRGLGILVNQPMVENISVALLVELIEAKEERRLDMSKTKEILGIQLPFFQLNAYDSILDLKILKAFDILTKKEVLFSDLPEEERQKIQKGR